MKEVKTIWGLKQSASDPSTLDMYIYGNVEGDYIDWWEWQKVQSETSANHFRNELAKYPDVKNINLYVNSYGGSVYEAMPIRNQLKRHGAYVTGYVDGFACSAASFILTACDKVIMYSNTMQMIHNMWNVVAGNAKQLRKEADDLDAIMEGNRKAYLEKSNGKITEEKLIELLDAETWLTAAQCLEYGLCDEIVAKEVDLTEAKQLLQKVNKSFEQQLSYNKALVAQARELSQSFGAKNSENTPPTPNEPKENKNIKLMAALFAKKEM
ncbi:ATP-dependent protease ClpP, protease subunit [Clostridium amylolyticum]|uniref:ATP-dependent Clp protease proteolytic subunit n=1 Tax=Clostridium amylolyticum TaxID=1121298 RepID=A0A1M6KZ66_9CLOT|nr:head maturation protease, ClpP-related [Clostridium amylolyticum]SHJ64257.1 ATP-dependent protease ClpP, protease subunit [Clostridium amylolyticum]